jgi:protein disulfide-isomerase
MAVRVNRCLRVTAIPPRGSGDYFYRHLRVQTTCAVGDLARHSSVKISRSVLPLAVSLFIVLAPSAKADPAWQTDYKKAQEEAKTNHRLLLVDFTGSDWCGYCIRFNREILSKEQFKDYASKNLVLLEVDFPRAKEQTPTLRQQNQRLAEEYQIEGFPTIVVLNGDGRKVWRFDGYFPNGPDAFIAELEKLRKS